MGNDTEKWCQIGTFEEIRIEHIMRSHAQNYYILNGERFEVEDNWEVDKTKS